MKARMKDLVRTPSGEVVTLGELADRGEVTFSRCDKFYKRGNGTRVAFFADHVSGDGSWEISKAAFESRTGSGNSLALAYGSDGSIIGGKDMSDTQFLAPLLGDESVRGGTA